MARGGGNRSRLLLVILLVTALFFITLDLRGVSLTKGSRSVTQTILSPVQRTVSTIFSPVGRFFSDVKNFGKTNAQLQDEIALNKLLKSQIAMNADTKGQLAQLKAVLDLAGRGNYKVLFFRGNGRLPELSGSRCPPSRPAPRPFQFPQRSDEGGVLLETPSVNGANSRPRGLPAPPS